MSGIKSVADQHYPNNVLMVAHGYVVEMAFAMDGDKKPDCRVSDGLIHI